MIVVGGGRVRGGDDDGRGEGGSDDGLPRARLLAPTWRLHLGGWSMHTRTHKSDTDTLALL